MAKEKKKKSWKFRIYRFLIILLILLLLAGFAGIRVTRMLHEPMDSSSKETVQVEIPKGSATVKIGQILEDEGIISSSLLFRIATRLDGDADYKAGTYSLSPSMTMNEIRKTLLEGSDDTNTVQLVIPEGFTLKDIAAEAEKAGVCKADAFLKAAASGTVQFKYLDQTLQGEKRLEGFLYPDTYEVYRGDDPVNVINKMLARFEEKYDAIVAASSGSPVLSKYNTLQIVTVASLIEREAFLDQDRAPIASVIYNRLDAGMKLQFNTTVEYILGEIRDLTYADLEIDNPYNTYYYAGLPVGPIASPGEESLKAAVNPADTQYMYFVTSDKGDNSMAFSVTYEDFLKDKEAWQASR
ncbi:MAG: endolytic transglycosylase MltG [Firmicutes bacterium]|nr:endolytic transglycosylase MltG [Bacillota bacterium]